MLAENALLAAANIQVLPSTEAVVLAHGCFDLLHAGHIEHLRHAASLGDRLVVSVTGDAFVSKGAWRPHFTAQQRAAHLRDLRFVDEVVVNDAPTAVPMIEKVRPKIYVKGIDYAGKEHTDGLAEEIAAVERVGGKIEYTQVPKFSSSRLLAKLQHGDGVDEYLDTCRARGFWPRIEDAFGKVRGMNIVFVGETIIDEYRYVAPLGKVSKEFALATVADGVEEFHGGALAASKQIARLCKSHCVTQRQSEIRKTRFVARDFGQKLFEVYSRTTLELNAAERREFQREVEAAVEFADAVVAIDFGHGLIDTHARMYLQTARFLAVNAQSNAGNHGFNTVNRYRHADYICVDAPEARLAAQKQHAPIADVIAALANEMEPGHLVVTHGRDGAYWKGGRVPALTTSPKDTIGAGDCFLAVTAPLIAAGLGVEEAALVGNVAGAMKTEIVGHRTPIDGEVLVQSVKSLLK